MAESLARIRLPSVEEGALTAACVAWFAMRVCHPSGCPGSVRSLCPGGGPAFSQGASVGLSPRAAPRGVSRPGTVLLALGGIFRGRPRSCQRPGQEGRHEACCLPRCCQGKAGGTVPGEPGSLWHPVKKAGAGSWHFFAGGFHQFPIPLLVEALPLVIGFPPLSLSSNLIFFSLPSRSASLCPSCLPWFNISHQVSILGATAPNIRPTWGMAHVFRDYFS